MVGDAAQCITIDGVINTISYKLPLTLFYAHVMFRLLFFLRECLINNYDNTTVNVQNSSDYFKQDVIIGIVGECGADMIA